MRTTLICLSILTSTIAQGDGASWPLDYGRLDRHQTTTQSLSADRHILAHHDLSAAPGADQRMTTTCHGQLSVSDRIERPRLREHGVRSIAYLGKRQTFAPTTIGSVPNGNAGQLQQQQQQRQSQPATAKIGGSVAQAPLAPTQQQLQAQLERVQQLQEAAARTQQRQQQTPQASPVPVQSQRPPQQAPPQAISQVLPVPTTPQRPVVTPASSSPPSATASGSNSVMTTIDVNNGNNIPIDPAALAFTQRLEPGIRDDVLRFFGM
ncbi:hypothetical protein PYCC9005_002781 [Savitreella phatthalungensis]